MLAVEVAALVVALVPILVVVVWAVRAGWLPLGDSGQIALRSRDVLTRHQPDLGSWSSSSQLLGEDLNNLGPMQVELLAPFTRWSPFAGTAVGAGALAAACTVGVWAVARRLAGSVGAVAAMAATVALEASMGTQALLETRQQLALLFPWWLLLWLAVALWRGERWALAPTAFVASLVVQTHFSFIYPAAVVLVVALVAPAVRRLVGRAPDGEPPTSEDPAPPRRSYAPLLAAAVALACWAQPLWDQWFGSGNLGRVLSHGGGSGSTPGARAPGLGVGAELGARTTLRPPFWFPRSMGEALDPPVLAGRVHPGAGTWLTLGLWVVALAGAAAVGHRRQHRLVVALAGTSIAALVGAVVAAAQIPPSSFGVYPPQNYYWMWPIGLLAWLALLGAVLEGVAAFERPGVVSAFLVRRRRWSMAVAGLAAAVILAVPTVAPASSLPYVHREATRGPTPGRAVIDGTDRALDGLDLDGPVVVDFTRDLSFTSYRWTVPAIIRDRGGDITFDAGTTDLRRFGRERCDGGRARWRLYVESGAGVASGSADEEEILLAAVHDPYGFDARFVLVPADRGAAPRCPGS